MSAGAIMLGKRWIRWPNEDAGDDEAETYECMGIVPFALDTHGEGDDWQEARSYAAVRARELGKKARAYGVPSGGALVIDHRGRIEAHGVAGTRFRGAAEAQSQARGDIGGRAVELFRSALAAGQRRNAAYGGRGAAVPRSPRAACRYRRAACLARAAAVRRQTRAAQGLSQIARSSGPGFARGHARRERDAACHVGHHGRSAAGHLGVVVVGPAGARGHAPERANRTVHARRRVTAKPC